MRDIGRQLQRRRLQRYQPAARPWVRRGRWLAALVALWLLYSTLLSDHGVYRIWQLQEQNRRADAEVASTSREIESLDAKLKDPERIRRRNEDQLRTRKLARPEEIIYIYSGEGDSAR